MLAGSIGGVVSEVQAMEEPLQVCVCVHLCVCVCMCVIRLQTLFC